MKTLKNTILDFVYERADDKIISDLLTDTNAISGASNPFTRAYVFIENKQELLLTIKNLNALYDCDCSPREDEHVIVFPMTGIIPTDFDIEIVETDLNVFKAARATYLATKQANYDERLIIKQTNDYTTVQTQIVDKRIEQIYKMDVFIGLSAGVQTTLRTKINGQMEKTVQKELVKLVKNEMAAEVQATQKIRIQNKFNALILLPRTTTVQINLMQASIARNWS